ncbi:MAG: DUF4105 domain-containing protein [Acetobacter sp.]|nr:DUF4105 domain-containing protein [Acetobacter sp.]
MKQPFFKCLYNKKWIPRVLLLFIASYAGAAFYYSTLTPVIFRWAIALLFPTVLLGCFLIPKTLIRRISIGCLITGFFIWYETDPPQNTRDWAAEYAIPARVTFEGNKVYINNIRHIHYKTVNDYTVHYTNATFDPNKVSSVDLIVSYWAGTSIAHVFLSFGFSDGRHLAISVETRRQKTFPYSTIAGFFHHYELFYVVADERDLIGVRTDIRKERVYLYHLNLSAPLRKQLFLNYLHAIQSLHEHPRWYNTLTTNCATEILSRAHTPLLWHLNWRVLLSGHIPALAYTLGLLDQRTSFTDLQRRSLIHRPSGATPDSPTYSEDIRKTLPPPFETKQEHPQNKTLLRLYQGLASTTQ